MHAALRRAISTNDLLISRPGDLQVMHLLQLHGPSTPRDLARWAGASVDLEFRLGSASAMPLESDQFDLLFCWAAFKNFAEPVRALQEMHPVLKPGRRALIIDLRRGASLGAINEAVAHMGLDYFSAWSTRMAFRFMLIRRAYTKLEVDQFLEKTQFGSRRVEETEMGMDIWLDK